MQFQRLVDRAIAIRRLYEEKERQLYGTSWTKEEIALGFVGDVGDLAKLVMAENGRRNIPNSLEKLEHELADCLWSVVVLAHLYDVDLERSFVNTMDVLEGQITDQNNGS